MCVIRYRSIFMGFAVSSRVKSFDDTRYRSKIQCRLKFNDATSHQTFKTATIGKNSDSRVQLSCTLIFS